MVNSKAINFQNLIYILVTISKRNPKLFFRDPVISGPFIGENAKVSVKDIILNDLEEKKIKKLWNEATRQLNLFQWLGGVLKHKNLLWQSSELAHSFSLSCMYYKSSLSSKSFLVQKYSHGARFGTVHCVLCRVRYSYNYIEQHKCCYEHETDESAVNVRYR